ncbi:hypothetical protein SAMN02745248_00578 [Hathewaya proteolytica DSM 3090]|uniref:Uncharacterized protein n=1 Tax=Hathewaya proteolytica DSM 3090 TaxID=1121331 RepID=A0A1M6L0T6_9CLOT|nr:hypothetical protein [Hathewaya proteolytica]SHJ64749.1 hypothetical protein SAMN02745248_00578 [Hathewaya proteolytica DSM 3090]
MYRIRMVVKYTNSTQEQVLKMPCDLFQANFKYAFIEDKMSTEEGREYLKKAERLKVTELDYKKIRKIKGYKAE